jgi:hypothetical protein
VEVIVIACPPPSGWIKIVSVGSGGELGTAVGSMVDVTVGSGVLVGALELGSVETGKLAACSGSCVVPWRLQVERRNDPTNRSRTTRLIELLSAWISITEIITESNSLSIWSRCNGEYLKFQPANRFIS